MKIAILETNHFQYLVTQTEVFYGCEFLLFVTDEIKKEILDYSSNPINGKFIIIDSIRRNSNLIIQTCNEEKIDLFFLNPLFGEFEAILKITNLIQAKKAFTIHNLNTWINASFWSIHSYKERMLKKKIVKSFDYLIVDDFVHQYVTKINSKISQKYQFIYLPFALFNPEIKRKYFQNDTRLKIVLPGAVHKERRRYEIVLKVISRMAKEKKPITFSFAGPTYENYGINVLRQLDEANKIHPGIATYFAFDEKVTPTQFLKEMETSDLVLSTSTIHFKSLGTTEIIGKTKSTGVIYDMVRFELPGLLPSHITVPIQLKESVINYADEEDLYKIFNDLLEQPEKLLEWKERAKKSSMNFTPDKVRKGLPFPI